MQEDLRERLGRRVREVWVTWAREQPSPKPSWLVPWDELGEPDKEVDRRIGAAIWGDCIAAYATPIATHALNQPGDTEGQSQGLQITESICRLENRINDLRLELEHSWQIWKRGEIRERLHDACEFLLEDCDALAKVDGEDDWIDGKREVARYVLRKHFGENGTR